MQLARCAPMLSSTTILGFVRRAVEDPTQLAAACEEFAALPYSKGFQMGFLTPALNALRPDDFLIVNSKSRAVINYFAETSYPNGLTEYPTLNEAGHYLIKEYVGELDSDGALGGIRHSDMFDAFSHWLIAIRNFNPKAEQFDTRLRPTRYWKIAPGEDAWQWKEWREEGFIAVG